MFDFAEETKNMTAAEILNYYRNCYYAEPQVTERGIVANAINDILPNMTEVVRCKDCRWARKKDHREPTDTPEGLICQCFKHHHIPAPWGARMAVNPDDFCSYGERKNDV